MDSHKLMWSASQKNESEEEDITDLVELSILKQAEGFYNYIYEANTLYVFECITFDFFW